MIQIIPSRKFYNFTLRKIIPCESVIEIGPGIRPIRLPFTPKSRVFLEPSLQYITILKSMFNQHEDITYVSKDALTGLSNFDDKSVDTVLLFDVIEHVTKPQGKLIISESERVAKLQVVIFTPFGFMPQHCSPDSLDPWGLNEQDLQTHLSGWIPSDFPSYSIFRSGQDFHRTPDHGNFAALLAIKNFQRASKVKIKTEQNPLEIVIVSAFANTAHLDNFLIKDQLLREKSGKDYALYGPKLAGEIASTKLKFGLIRKPSNSLLPNIEFHLPRKRSSRLYWELVMLFSVRNGMKEMRHVAFSIVSFSVMSRLLCFGFSAKKVESVFNAKVAPKEILRVFVVVPIRVFKSIFGHTFRSFKTTR